MSGEMTGNEYFDLNAILCDQTSIPVQFNLDIPAGLASLLETREESRDIKELPLWLTQQLAQPGYVQATMPRSFSQEAQNKLKADAKAVPLGMTSPHYYELGTKLAVMEGTEIGQDLVQSLSVAFATRYKIILNRFPNTEDRNSMKYLPTLTAPEQRIYTSGQHSLRQHANWKRRRTETIEHAPIVRMTKRVRR